MICQTVIRNRVRHLEYYVSWQMKEQVMRNMTRLRRREEGWWVEEQLARIMQHRTLIWQAILVVEQVRNRPLGRGEEGR